MQVSVESVTNIERRITVGVPSERIETEVDKRLQKAAQNARIDGFRPGKVPFKVVKQRYGAGVRQEVVGEVVQETFYEAVNQEKLRPAGFPQIEPKVMEEGEDLEYVATFEIYPEVTLGDLSQIEVKKPTATITDEDIDKMIEQLRQQRTSMEPTERAAKEHDQVMIDFEGKIDGEVFPGGTAENTPLVLGSSQMIPGFEDGITGMSAEEEKVLSLNFPEDYHAEDLAGKAVEFTVKVNQVNEPVVPELNDEFFAMFGVSEGGEEKFREEVRSNMERELKNAVKNKIKSQVIVGLIDSQKLEVPKALLDQEVDRLRQEMTQQYGGGQQGFDPSMLPADLFMDQATQRVSMGLLLTQFVTDNKIELDEARVDVMIDEMADTYEKPEEVVSFIRSNEQQMEQLRSVVLEEQAIEKMLEQMNLIEEPTSYEDAVRPPEPASKPAEEAPEEEASEEETAAQDQPEAKDEGAQ